jgi:hypothetical protein
MKDAEFLIKKNRAGFCKKFEKTVRFRTCPYITGWF